uniref:Uncharacterized protein n=1 Tax=Oryza nivara TaxID=4536 RepID=A0A0E0J6F8_ORYNI
MDPPVADTVAPPVGGSTSTSAADDTSQPVPHLTPPHAAAMPDLQGEGGEGDAPPDPPPPCLPSAGSTRRGR